jgi:hypothetical protein
VVSVFVLFPDGGFGGGFANMHERPQGGFPFGGRDKGEAGMRDRRERMEIDDLLLYMLMTQQGSSANNLLPLLLLTQCGGNESGLLALLALSGGLPQAVSPAPAPVTGTIVAPAPVAPANPANNSLLLALAFSGGLGGGLGGFGARRRRAEADEGPEEKGREEKAKGREDNR